jgi:hypothetical protein
VSFPFGQTVTVHRYALDRLGDRAETEHHTVAGCGFAPRVSTENTDRAEQVTATAELYTPTGADIGPQDVIELADGSRWEVTGDPQRWVNPLTGWHPGGVVLLTKVTG